MSFNEKNGSFPPSNNPPPYTPTPSTYNAPPAPQIIGPVGPAPSGPQMMMNQPPMINKAPQMKNMQMVPPNMVVASGLQYTPPLHPQMYPYNVGSLVTNVETTSDPCLARCPACHSIGMTRVEKKFSTCQLVVGILLICTCYLIVPGLLVLFLTFDYEHFCLRCNTSIGKKKTCCC